jgi:hypothetical protein
MSPDPGRRSLRLPRVRVPLIWACGLAIALAAAFVLVRSTLRTEPTPRPDWRDVERVRHFERLSRELGGLLLELEQAPPAASVAERAVWESRIANDLRPRVTEFRRQVLSVSLDGPAYEALLRASDRLGAAAANPGDSRALDAARTARDELQARVREESAAVRGG